MILKYYYRIFKALYYSDYSWRTKKGISEELNLDMDIIDVCINRMGRRGLLYDGRTRTVVHNTGEITSRKIYRLRYRYEKETNFMTKLLDAIRGEVIR